MDKAISFMFGAIAMGLLSFFPPAGKPTEGTEVLRSAISPQECLRMGGKIQYTNDEVYQGVRGCWLRGTEP